MKVHIRDHSGFIFSFVALITIEKMGWGITQKVKLSISFKDFFAIFLEKIAQFMEVFLLKKHFLNAKTTRKMDRNWGQLSTSLNMLLLGYT